MRCLAYLAALMMQMALICNAIAAIASLIVAAKMSDCHSGVAPAGCRGTIAIAAGTRDAAAEKIATELPPPRPPPCFPPAISAAIFSSRKYSAIWNRKGEPLLAHRLKPKSLIERIGFVGEGFKPSHLETTYCFRKFRSTVCRMPPFR